MPKAQYAVFRAPGDWTDAMYDEYDGPELGKKFKDYARRKVGGRGAQAETVFTRKIVAAAPVAAAAPVVEVEAGDNEEDAVMAALTAGMAGMGMAAAAPVGAGGEGNAMQEGGRRRRHHRKSRKAGRKSRKAGRKGASRRSKSRKTGRKSRRHSRS